MYRLACWLLLSFVVSAGCRLHPPAAPPRHTNLGISISRLDLSNGLPVVIVRDPRAPEVQVTMRYRVGSVDDPEGQEGMAHLVEHLMFQQVLGSQSLFAHLQSHATSFNGVTTLDATTYFARAPVSRLEELLSIEAVRVGSRCTSITDSVFAREREVVVNEVRQRDAATTMREDLYRGLYPDGHPYRRRSAGTPEGVAAMTREQACAFADAHYAPSNAVLVVSGDVTPDQVSASLKKFLARIPKRTAIDRAPVPRIDLQPRRTETTAQVDQDILLVAWPLPADPAAQARVRAVATATEASIRSATGGSTQLLVLGDERAPLVGIVVLPAEDELMDDVVKQVQRAVSEAPEAFAGASPGPVGELVFDRLKQTAIFGLYATLEDGSGRDLRLAADVVAGRDPAQTLAASFAGLRELSRASAAQISREELSIERATVVVMHAQSAAKTSHDVDLKSTVEDAGLRREVPDPAEAHRPLPAEAGARGFAALRTRVLPNGMKVVLLPLTSVPTVEVRLVFGAGTADEPRDKRGVAQLAAWGLSWDMHYLNDLMLFAAAGGSGSVDVNADRTAFSAQGLDMHIDLLLAGMRRWIREGHYDFDADVVSRAVKKYAGESHDTGALNDAWRAGLFGKDHPYAAASEIGTISDSLSIPDVQAFRASHYTPDNATLVIAGGFDPELADRWVDFLFHDWSGHAVARSSPVAHPQPVSLARAKDAAQARLALAFPAAGGDRASRLVAAAMLDEITSDVRHQLGATYGLFAELEEMRLGSLISTSGYIEAGRLRDAVVLIQARLDKLKQDPDALASTFAAARARVATHLVSLTGRASLLAQRIDTDVSLGRAALSDLQTAAAVRALTVEAMGPALADLDLARAAVQMQGPDAEVRSAFEALGRTPTFIEAAMTPRVTTVDAEARDAERRRADDRLRFSDLSDAITTQGPPTDYLVEADVGISAGKMRSYDASGFTVSGFGAYRLDPTTAVGLRAAVGRESGDYIDQSLDRVPHTFHTTALDVAGVVSATAYDRLWGALFAGVHFDRVVDNSVTRWYPGLAVGLEGAFDLVKLDGHRLGVLARVQSEIVPSERSVELTVGVSYRR